MKAIPQVTAGFSAIGFLAVRYKVGVKFNLCALMENGIPSSQLLPKDFTCSRAVANGEVRTDSIWWLSTLISLMKLIRLLTGDI